MKSKYWFNHSERFYKLEIKKKKLCESSHERFKKYDNVTFSYDLRLSILKPLMIIKSI